MNVNSLPVATTINQLDIEQPRREHFFELPTPIQKWCITHLLKGQQEQNRFILLVMVNILLTSLPMAIGLYWLEGQINGWWIAGLGAAYFYFHITTYARSFILALHYSTHTPIFNKKWRFLKHLNTSFLCTLFGIPPWMYYAHHIAMHHSENNTMPYDLSSTMPYQRDSKWHHFLYMLRFAIAIWVELPYVLFRKRNYQVMARCIAGECLFFLGISLLLSYRPMATTFVFLLPVTVISFALMQGNWKQHIFVDPDDPTNNYKSTFTCINTPTNAGNFNDGYHIEHHENPAMPWYRLPEYFQSKLPEYAKNDGFIFTGIGSMAVGRLVLNQDLDTLADHYLNVGQKQRTKAELIAEFKRRLAPIRA